MALQIANPVVVAKIDALAKSMGTSKTAAVEKAVDVLLSETKGAQGDIWDRFKAILEQIDRIPDLTEPFDPLEWDEHGLPK